PRAPRDPVDESLWDKTLAAPTGVLQSYSDVPVGINMGTQFTVTVLGDIHQIGYYRGDASQSPAGKLALWQISDFTDLLLVEVDFSGHTGTGWRMIDIDPIRVKPSEGYLLTMWLPGPVVSTWFHYG